MIVLVLVLVQTLPLLVLTQILAPALALVLVLVLAQIRMALVNLVRHSIHTNSRMFFTTLKNFFYRYWRKGSIMKVARI